MFKHVHHICLPLFSKVVPSSRVRPQLISTIGFLCGVANRVILWGLRKHLDLNMPKLILGTRVDNLWLGCVVFSVSIIHNELVRDPCSKIYFRNIASEWSTVSYQDKSMRTVVFNILECVVKPNILFYHL